MRKLRLLLLVYSNKFTLIIAGFIILHFILATFVATRGKVRQLDFEYLKVAHYNFSTALFSAIPVSLFVSNSLEFTKGIASKFICSGVTRSEYYRSKIMQALVVSSATVCLYILLNTVLICLFQMEWSDSAVLIQGIWMYFATSILVNLFVTNLSFCIYDWKIGVVTYIAYCFLESILVFIAGDDLPVVKWLPIHLLTSFFLLENIVLLSQETFLKFLAVIGLLVIIHLIAIKRFQTKSL